MLGVSKHPACPIGCVQYAPCIQLYWSRFGESSPPSLIQGDSQKNRVNIHSNHLSGQRRYGTSEEKRFLGGLMCGGVGISPEWAIYESNPVDYLS